jgi:uncharacterized protein YukJ
VYCIDPARFAAGGSLRYDLRIRREGVIVVMPIRDYGVLKGAVLRRTLDRRDQTPHYHIQVDADGELHRVAVNVRSGLDGLELLTAVDNDFEHAICEEIARRRSGFSRLEHEPGSGALDYQRGEMVKRSRFRTTPRLRDGEGGLPDLLDVYVRRAISDPAASLYAFGTKWGPDEGETDRTFRGHPIRPSRGVHDVHMNQGNVDGPGERDDQHFRENGPWQDGGLLFHFPDQEQWVGIFLAFQNQSWQTDDRTGRPLARGHANPGAT